MKRKSINRNRNKEKEKGKVKDLMIGYCYKPCVRHIINSANKNKEEIIKR